MSWSALRVFSLLPLLRQGTGTRPRATHQVGEERPCGFQWMHTLRQVSAIISQGCRDIHDYLMGTVKVGF